MKPFNLEAALRGEPLVTRDGRKVSNFTQIGPPDIKFPYAAYIDGNPGVASFTDEGTFTDKGKLAFSIQELASDLFMAEKLKKKLYFLLHKNTKFINENYTPIKYSTSFIFESKEELLTAINKEPGDNCCQKHQIIEIEIEDE